MRTEFTNYHTHLSFYSFSPRISPTSSECSKARPSFILRHASLTSQKWVGPWLSAGKKSLRVRSSTATGLKTRSSTLKARACIASRLLEKIGTRKPSRCSSANQSPLARCIAYIVFIRRFDVQVVRTNPWEPRREFAGIQSEEQGDSRLAYMSRMQYIL